MQYGVDIFNVSKKPPYSLQPFGKLRTPLTYLVPWVALSASVIASEVGSNPPTVFAMVGGLVNNKGVVQDCNADLAEGTYIINKDSGTINSPIGYGCLTVRKSKQEAGSPIVQTIVPYGGKTMLQRMSWAGSMSEWVTLSEGLKHNDKLEAIDLNALVGQCVNVFSQASTNKPFNNNGMVFQASASDKYKLQLVTDGVDIFIKLFWETYWLVFKLNAAKVQ